MGASTQLQVTDNVEGTPTPPRGTAIYVSHPEDLLYLERPASGIFFVHFEGSDSISNASGSPVAPTPTYNRRFYGKWVS